MNTKEEETLFSSKEKNPSEQKCKPQVKLSSYS